MSNQPEKSFVDIISMDSELSKDAICKAMGGFYITVENIHYTITCKHGISSYTYVNHKREEVLAVAPEFDLALLTGNEGIHINDIVYDIKSIGDGTIVYQGDHGITYQKAVFSGITFWSPYTNIPKNPYVIIKCNTVKHGMSGGLFIVNGKLVGIISNNNLSDGVVYVIPSFVIVRFISEYIQSNKYRGICSFAAKIDTVSAQIGDTEEYMAAIDDCFNINYNNHDATRAIGWNLRNKDLIVSIDDHKLNQDWFIHCEHLGVSIPYDTYIALHFKAGDLFNITVYREKDDDYKKLSFKICARPINTTLQLPIVGDSIESHGIIFSEMSIELANKHKLKIKNIYRDSNERILVVTDIISDALKFKHVILSNDHDFWKCIKKNGKNVKKLGDIETLRPGDTLTFANNSESFEVTI